MKASGRVVGALLAGAGVIIGVGVVAWLIQGIREDRLEGSGAIFGLILLFGVLVIPLIGGGIYFMIRGQQEAKELERIQKQRRLLDIVSTQGRVSISDLVLELNSTRDQVQSDLYDVVGRGLFSGYVDWNSGALYSVDAKKLQGSHNCPNCGGQLELAGKGLVKCPYCGAEIFLT
jgi:DNA-directed RNA polymerase subunit RPC12/RpoP